jgi:hypothetical protein
MRFIGDVKVVKMVVIGALKELKPGLGWLMFGVVLELMELEFGF